MKPSSPSRWRTVVGFALVVAVVAAVVLSGSAAQRRALAAEEVYVADQLRDEPCLSDWGINEGTGTGRATVTGVTAGGIRVAVDVPYAYTTRAEGETIHADTASEAVYDVTPADARRVRGDDVSICRSAGREG